MSTVNRVQWHRLTALFGGTFDPPHLGHLRAVAGLFRSPGVQRVVVLPSADPPHKSAQTSSRHRIEMTRRCFGNLPSVSVDAREVDRHATSGAPSYSLDTILELRRESPELGFVIGADQLSKLHEWNRFTELLTACHWIVLSRRPDGEAVAHETLAEWKASGLLQSGSNDREWSLPKGPLRAFNLILCDTDAPELSSSSIRESIARSGQVPELAVPESVSRYLKENHLYGT